MRYFKKLFSALLAVTMMLTISVPAFAAANSSAFSDVPTDAWYSEAVAYVHNNGIMSGTTDTTFQPDTPMNRGMLATVLYRMAGNPAVSGTDSFTDTEDNTWYSNSVKWASEKNIINGYGNSLFGINDAVTREQIATILWRYAGSPQVNKSAETFADVASISAWAVDSVNWAKENNIMTGRDGNLFVPLAHTTRAEVATMLYNYLTKYVLQAPTPPTQEVKSLVVYFSMPETKTSDNMTTEEANSTVVINGEVLGNTQYVAYLIEKNTGSDIFRIEPKTPYPTNHSTLVNLASKEQAEKARPELLANVENIEQYDVIFLGYPNWWGDMPMVLYTFLEANDLSGKTIIPFNTHGGSGFSSTINTIAQLQPNATVERNGFTVSRNSAAECENDLIAWLKSMDFVK